MILLEAAPTAFANIGYKFWIILICLTFIYGVLVYFFLPEVSCSGIQADRPTNSNTGQTKGMTLEDISVLFGDPVELSFEQALRKQERKGGEYETPLEAKEDTSEKVEHVK